MKVITWASGTNREYDQLFDDLRSQQFNNKELRLWKNYDTDFYDMAVALTICFNNDGDPEMCSSIASRDCWPEGCYRILNRLWKHSNKIPYPRVMSPSFGLSTSSQIEWLTEHTNAKLYFISRQTPNWEKWCIRQFKQQFNLDFKNGINKYLTCPNEYDESCWQTIIYNGDETLLNQWKKKI